MHRSGTSAITRGLQVLGVELGDRLLPLIEGDNAKGFWEDIDLNALNIEILSALNSDWHHLAPIEPSDVEALRKKSHFLRAVEFLKERGYRDLGGSPSVESAVRDAINVSITALSG